MFARWFRISFLLLPLCLSAASLGCQTWDGLESDSLFSGDSNPGAGLRRTRDSETDKGWFLDQRSKDISKNLGW